MCRTRVMNFNKLFGKCLQSWVCGASFYKSMVTRMFAMPHVLLWDQSTFVSDPFVIQALILKRTHSHKEFLSQVQQYCCDLYFGSLQENEFQMFLDKRFYISPYARVGKAKLNISFFKCMNSWIPRTEDRCCHERGVKRKSKWVQLQLSKFSIHLQKYW